MKKWVYIVIAAAILAVVAIIWGQSFRITQLKDERNRYERNTETLLSDVKHYRVRDSLNAARVQSLELTVQEYERFRADDAALIKELQQRNRDLAAVNKTQSQTIIELRAIPRDTVVIRDSVRVPAVSVHCGDAWYNFDGLLTKDEFTGKMEHRDSLLLVESVRYKRFLWWKTKRIKDRQLDCVSKSPHNSIIGLEYVVIEK